MTRLMEFSKQGVAVENISVSFKGQRVLDSLSINILPGEIIALLGPSGCGKTTTLRAIAGLQEPSEGEIRVGNKSMINVPPYLRGVGMVFQNYALFPHMTVADNVAFGLKMQNLSRNERDLIISTTLELLGLLPLRDSYPAKLSGGQQQRVAVARTIATRPSVLLLDEPLSALDKKLRDSTRIELRELLKKVGITAIIVTHDQEEALAIADRVAVMNRGQIAQIGTGDELYNNPNTRFVADFVGYMNYLPGRIASVDEGHATVEIGTRTVVKTPLKQSFGSGEKVEVAVRPEMIGISLHAAIDGGADTNEIAVRFVSEEFLGILNYMRFKDDAEHEILVIQTGKQIETHFSYGDRCYLQWKVKHTSCMKN